MSEGDYLKIKLQLLQFQTDVSAAKLARVQALAGLRQFLGFESVPTTTTSPATSTISRKKPTLVDLKVLASRSVQT